MSSGYTRFNRLAICSGDQPRFIFNGYILEASRSARSFLGALIHPSCNQHGNRHRWPSMSREYHTILVMSLETVLADRCRPAPISARLNPLASPLLIVSRSPIEGLESLHVPMLQRCIRNLNPRDKDFVAFVEGCLNDLRPSGAIRR